MSAGRKSKLSDELIKKLVKHMSEYPISYACPLSGITEKTFYNWRDAAEELQCALDSDEISEDDLTDHDELLLLFLQSTKLARAKLEIQFYDTWKRAAKRWKDAQTGKMKNGNWMAAKEMLAKLNPKEFGNIPPQLLAEMLQNATDEESESCVIEAPSITSNDDPVSAFMQAASSQQKNTTELSNQKQQEEQQ